MKENGADYQKARLVTREQTHRRTVLLGIGLLILLVLSPLFSHHFAEGTEALLAGKDHIGALCLIALHTLLEPVHGLFHLVFLAGIAYAVADRARAWWHGRAVLHSLVTESLRSGDPFFSASRLARVDPRLLRVVAGLPTPAFTVGWLRPRIYIAQDLATRLTLDELAAVVAHEGAHAARRDPLRLSLLRFLTCTLFWIPALRRLAEDVADEAEIQADDAVASNPLVLASAIVALARGVSSSSVAPQSSVGFQKPGLLERRVRRLLGEDPVPGSHLTRRSLLSASAALVLMFVSGAVMAHPLPAQDAEHHPIHCQHHDGPPLTHLFCLTHGWTFAQHGCPVTG